MKLPSLQFYPGDWLKDPNLRAVSLAARGMWIDMLCLMHENDRRGYLQLASGKPVTAEHLARMTGCSPDEASRLLQELEDSGVFSRAEHGVIFNRRMVRDERRRQTNRENGKKGGNPNLVSDNRLSNRPPNRTINRNPTPSSSSSTSVGEEEREEESGVVLRMVDGIVWAPGRGWLGISQTDRESWGVAYPACDIDRQLAAMTEWLRSNPDRAHKKQWRRFITNWLGRSQERGGDSISRKPTGTYATGNTPAARRSTQEAREYD